MNTLSPSEHTHGQCRPDCSARSHAAGLQHTAHTRTGEQERRAATPRHFAAVARWGANATTARCTKTDGRPASTPPASPRAAFEPPCQRAQVSERAPPPRRSCAPQLRATGDAPNKGLEALNDPLPSQSTGLHVCCAIPLSNTAARLRCYLPARWVLVLPAGEPFRRNGGPGAWVAARTTRSFLLATRTMGTCAFSLICWCSSKNGSSCAKE